MCVCVCRKKFKFIKQEGAEVVERFRTIRTE